MEEKVHKRLSFKSFNNKQGVGTDWKIYKIHQWEAQNLIFLLGLVLVADRGTLVHCQQDQNLLIFISNLKKAFYFLSLQYKNDTREKILIGKMKLKEWVQKAKLKLNNTQLVIQTLKFPILKKKKNRILLSKNKITLTQ